MVQMLGWLSAAAARASRKNRPGPVCRLRLRRGEISARPFGRAWCPPPYRRRPFRRRRAVPERDIVKWFVQPAKARRSWPHMLVMRRKQVNAGKAVWRIASKASFQFSGWGKTGIFGPQSREVESQNAEGQNESTGVSRDCGRGWIGEFEPAGLWREPRRPNARRVVIGCCCGLAICNVETFRLGSLRRMDYGPVRFACVSLHLQPDHRPQSGVADP